MSSSKLVLYHSIASPSIVKTTWATNCAHSRTKDLLWPINLRNLTQIKDNWDSTYQDLLEVSILISSILFQRKSLMNSVQGGQKTLRRNQTTPKLRSISPNYPLKLQTMRRNKLGNRSHRSENRFIYPISRRGLNTRVWRMMIVMILMTSVKLNKKMHLNHISLLSRTNLRWWSRMSPRLNCKLNMRGRTKFLFTAKT